MIHVFGSCEKKLDYIGKVIVPSCVLWGGGVGDAVFSLGSSFSICFFRQKYAIFFHSLKAREFFCRDEGEGTEAILVNKVEIIPYRLFDVCSSLFIYFSDVFGKD